MRTVSGGVVGTGLTVSVAVLVPAVGAGEAASTKNEAWVSPDAMPIPVTCGCMTPLGSDFVMVTATPLAGAGSLIVTVAVVWPVPPWIDVGDTDTPVTLGPGMSVK